MLAAFLLTVVVLGVVGLSLAVIASSRKSNDTQTAQLVARQLLEQQVDEALATPGSSWWGQNSADQVYSQETVVVAGTDYRARVYLTDLALEMDTDALATANNSRLKRVEVVVNWWDGEVKSRSGYGNLQVRSSRLLYEP